MLIINAHLKQPNREEAATWLQNDWLIVTLCPSRESLHIIEVIQSFFVQSFETRFEQHLTLKVCKSYFFRSTNNIFIKDNAEGQQCILNKEE